jgi:hypothetical protein
VFKRSIAFRISSALSVSDPDGDPLTVRWVLQADPLKTSMGGDAEAIPAVFPEAIVRSDLKGASIVMPSGGGGYRLFAYVLDDHGGAAVANIPLYVTGPVTAAKGNPITLPLVVYDEAGRDRRPYAPSNWMGNTRALKLDERCEVMPHGGKTCVRIDYMANDQWAGIAWADPPNDWGDKPGGWDITGAKRLSLWLRGERGDERVNVELGIIGREKSFPDTGNAKKSGLALSTEWQQFTLDVSNKDLSRLKTGLVITFAGSGAPFTVYLDDCAYE